MQFLLTLELLPTGPPFVTNDGQNLSLDGDCCKGPGPRILARPARTEGA